MEEERKIVVVVVEEEEAAKTAMRWALHNLIRYGDVITLLHVFPFCRRRSKKRLRLLRRHGYNLALSFQHLCSSSHFFNTKIEIVVTEDDEGGGRMVDLVREMGAFALVVGLHDRSFLYRMAMRSSNVGSIFNCRVMAIHHQQPPPSSFSSPDFDFYQIHLAPLQVPDVPPAKVPYKICPNPTAIIWRSKKTRRRHNTT